MSNIIEYRKVIETEVSNPKVMGELMRTTFKGLPDQETVKQAIMEGMVRGFTIADFLKKKIYATPFWNSKERKMGYALVEAISNVREIAMKSGQTGKSEPRYEYDDQGNILSCSITIYKKDGHDNGYTSKVFFKEYEKPPTKKQDGTETPGMWQTKPHTMIAKVAEMHALRSAFPELAQSYIEEEFQKEETIRYDEPEDNTPQKSQSEIEFESTMNMLKSAKTVLPLKIYLDKKLPISKYDETQKQTIKDFLEKRIKELEPETEPENADTTEGLPLTEPSGDVGERQA